MCNFPIFPAFLFSQNFIYLFLQRKEGRKERRKTSMCGYLLHLPYWGPGPQPRHVPWLGNKLVTLWFAGWCSIHWATAARADIYIFSYIYGPYVYPVRSVYSSPLPIFLLGCLSSWCWVLWVLCIFWRLNPYTMYHWQMCSLMWSVSFSFWWWFLAMQKLYNLV